MKKKRGNPDKPSGNSRLTPAKKTKVFSIDSRRHEQSTNQSDPTIINRTVPIQSIFNRLFQDVGHIQISTVTKSRVHQKSLTPSTPINKRKCVLGKF